MAEILEIAERVEKLMGPDHGLDQKIHAKVVAPHLYDHIMWPAYTASIDAAMTLVPDGLVWDVTSTGTAWVDLTGSGEIEIGRAKSPALALCCAALRALTRFREAQAGGGA